MRAFFPSQFYGGLIDFQFLSAHLQHSRPARIFPDHQDRSFTSQAIAPRRNRSRLGIIVKAKTSWVMSEVIE
jgi:hypothetical protein